MGNNFYGIEMQSYCMICMYEGYAKWNSCWLKLKLLEQNVFYVGTRAIKQKIVILISNISVFQCRFAYKYTIYNLHYDSRVRIIIFDTMVFISNLAPKSRI